MRRLLVHVEGQTEEQFVNEIVAPYLGIAASPAYRRGSWGLVASVLTEAAFGRGPGSVARWSVISGKTRGTRRTDGRLLWHAADWPGRTSAPMRPLERRAAALAGALREDFPWELRARVFPCVLMHEFEAFVFADIDRAVRAWGLEAVGPKLREVRSAFPSPEHINDSPITAPSKRIQAVVDGYEKPLMGALAVLEIGVERLRLECASLPTGS